MKRILASIALAVASVTAVPAVSVAAPPPAEAYGDLETVRSMSMSPDGEHIAYIKREQGRDFLTVAKIGGGIVRAVEIDGFQARGVRWGGNNHAIVIGTKMTYEQGIGEYRYGAAISLNIRNGKTAQLLSKGQGLAPYQTSASTSIDYIYDDGESVLMPGRTSSGGRAMFKVDLDTGRGKRVYNLSDRLVLLDKDGEIAFEVDYDRSAKRYEITQRTKSGDSRTVWKEEGIKTDVTGQLFPKVRLAGYGPNREKLLVWYNEEQSPDSMAELKGLTLDGQIVDSGLENPLNFEQINNVIMDADDTILGVSYAGIVPTYEFFDEDLNNLVRAAQATFPDAAVRLTTSNKDRSRIIFNVSGGSASGEYYMIDRNTGGLLPIGRNRPDIPPEQVGYVELIEFRARDGNIIPALITWPAGVEPGEISNAPLVVLPHGGPEAHDELGFDWMAQLPASRGIIVIQPQFRGSDGFGREFRDAGRGKWGREMQDDVTDAVKYMVDQGYADPDRVCIFGWSYGGYAAMAGATFTPDVYKCVIAGAGVSDLPRMLYWESKETGSRSPVVAYWNRVIGDRREEADKLKDISPVNFVSQVSAPVLLIHGDDDDVVPIEQSEVFEDALEKAGKQVEFIVLKDEDHWMSTAEGRIQVAKAVDEFLTRHLLTPR